ncbi:MAG: hypothetical protein WD826_02670, partial [Actinomycetota bacterium]
GVAKGLADDPTTAMVRFYSLRAQRIFDLATGILGSSHDITRVMATQVVVPFFTQEILSFDEGAAKTDALAIAPYFGTTISEAPVANEIKSVGADGVFDWLTNDNNATIGYGSLESVDDAVADQVDAANDFGVPVIAYEGGQHFVGALGFEDDAALNTVLDEVNRDPRIENVYLDYLNAFANRTGGTLWHFVNCDRWSKFGRWGALEYQEQERSNAPKYNALLTFMGVEEPQ